MNLHFKDITIFNHLKEASLVSCEFGSSLYKTNDENSDVDIHYIYATSNKELNSFVKSHHHLQYIEDGIDHVFVNLHTFILNTIKGDSTVLFEIIQSDILKDTALNFIYEMKYAFINYSIIRSYLGFANRDFRKYHTKVTHREQLKSICHIYRGYYFAKSLMEGNFRLINDEFLDKVKEIKLLKEDDYVGKKKLLNSGVNIVSDLRMKLNEDFDRGRINLPKYMTIENQTKLDFQLSSLMEREEFKEKQLRIKNMDLTIFYDAFENNEIKY